MDHDDDERRAWFRRDILPLEPDLLAYARRFCRDGESDPEDLVHDTFARAIAYKAWREVLNPSAFAARVLRNTALDALRRRKVLTITAVADFERLGLADDMPTQEDIAVGPRRASPTSAGHRGTAGPVPQGLHTEEGL
jgi:RNA polymerase sigma factor (sigma-70 family)